MESLLWPQKCSINSPLVAIKYYLLKHLNFTPNLCLDLDVNTFPLDNSSKKVDKKVFLVKLNKKSIRMAMCKEYKTRGIERKIYHDVKVSTFKMRSSVLLLIEIHIRNFAMSL